MAPEPNSSGMYAWCSGMNSGVAGETAANEVCVCVCVCVCVRACARVRVCVCVQEIGRTNRKNRLTERIVT